MSASLRERAFSGVRWTATATAVTAALQLLQLAVLARWLSPAEFGLAAIATIVIGFAQTFADAGVTNAVIHRRDSTREELSSLYWFNLLVAAGVSIVVVATTPLASLFRSARGVEPLIPLAAGVVFMAAPGQLFRALLERDLRFRRVALGEVCSTMAGVAVCIALVTRGTGVASLFYGQLTINTVASAIWIGGEAGTWFPALRLRTAEFKPFLGFGMYQVGARLLTYLASNIDKVVVAAVMSPHALGLYSVAYGLMIRPLMMLNPIITRVAFPVFAALGRDNERTRAGYLRVMQGVSLVTVPAYAAMSAVALPLVEVMLGREWLTATPVFRILCLLGVLYSLINPVGSLFLARGRADIGFWFNVLVVPVNAAAAFIGLRWGVVGVAWALVLSTLLIVFPVEFSLRRRLIGMEVSEYLRQIAPALAASLAGGLVLAAAQRALGATPPLLQLSLLGALGLVLAGIALLLLRRRVGESFGHRAVAAPPTDGGDPG